MKGEEAVRIFLAWGLLAVSLHAAPRVLTRVEQIRRLTPEQAARAYRVRVRGRSGSSKSTR